MSDPTKLIQALRHSRRLFIKRYEEKGYPPLPLHLIKKVTTFKRELGGIHKDFDEAVCLNPAYPAKEWHPLVTALFYKYYRAYNTVNTYQEGEHRMEMRPAKKLKETTP